MIRTTLVFIALLTSMAFTARAQNLVVNPGFETGNFTGWTQTGDTNFTGVSGIMPHSGNFAADLGPRSAGGGDLEQTLTTMIGQTYQVSFWLAVDSRPGNNPNFFMANFGGVNLLSLVDSNAFGYTQFTANVTATSTSSLLEFDFRHVNNQWHLDDVSVMAVPEPGTVGLISLGALGLLCAARRRCSV